jgi:hypothetical protein
VIPAGGMPARLKHKRVEVGGPDYIRWQHCLRGEIHLFWEHPIYREILCVGAVFLLHHDLTQRAESELIHQFCW